MGCFFLRVKQFGNNVCVGNSFGEMSFSSRVSFGARMCFLLMSLSKEAIESGTEVV